jgi:hypothetical protein
MNDKASGGISLIPPEKTTENEENSDPALNWKPVVTPTGMARSR